MIRKDNIPISRYVFTATLTVMLLITLFIYANTRHTIQRERAVLREGPGSFYDIVVELPVGAQVIQTGEEEDWYQVSYGSYAGYLSPRMTEKAPVRQDIFSTMGMQETSLDVSQHAMSAGVKGFGERFTNTFKGDKSFLELALTYQMNARAYRDFKRDTYRGLNVRRIRRRTAIPKSNAPDYYTIAEEGLGLGIASRIASLGLYRNNVMHEYVNYVGNLIVEASDVFDNTYKFFILDIPNPNAYATPGGIIFITKGMLQLIDTEAELALVLAHEIAHSARFHGVIELEQRKHQIGADDAFAQMDNFFDEFMPGAVSQEAKDLIDEMEQEAFKIFETLIQGRLDEYEEEADYLGMIYSMRAGYAPQGLISLLERMISSKSLSNNEHYTPDSNRMRITKMTNNIRNLDLARDLFTQRDRYQRYKRNL